MVEVSRGLIIEVVDSGTQQLEEFEVERVYTSGNATTFLRSFLL